MKITKINHHKKKMRILTKGELNQQPFPPSFIKSQKSREIRLKKLEKAKKYLLKTLGSIDLLKQLKINLEPCSKCQYILNCNDCEQTLSEEMDAEDLLFQKHLLSGSTEASLIDGYAIQEREKMTISNYKENDERLDKEDLSELDITDAEVNSLIHSPNEIAFKKKLKCFEEIDELEQKRKIIREAKLLKKDPLYKEKISRIDKAKLQKLREENEKEEDNENDDHKDNNEKKIPGTPIPGTPLGEGILNFQSDEILLNQQLDEVKKLDDINVEDLDLFDEINNEDLENLGDSDEKSNDHNEFNLYKTNEKK